MRRSAVLVLALVLVLSAFAGLQPGFGRAQESGTPVAGGTPGASGTPTFQVVPGVSVDVLGMNTAVGGTDLNHWLLRVTENVDAKPVKNLNVDSTLIAVESGSIGLTRMDGAKRAEVTVDRGGDPIYSSELSGHRLICKSGTCELPPDLEVVLGPENSATLEGATYVVTPGKEQGVFVVTVAGRYLTCWPCPCPYCVVQ